MSLRLTSVCLREPMIKFTYAMAKNGDKSATASVKAGSAAFAQQMGVRTTAEQVVYETFDQLPPNLRPRLMTEVEMETVAMGGVAPYVPKHLQKKKK